MDRNGTLHRRFLSDWKEFVGWPALLEHAILGATKQRSILHAIPHKLPPLIHLLNSCRSVYEQYQYLSLTCPLGQLCWEGTTVRLMDCGNIVHANFESSEWQLTCSMRLVGGSWCSFCLPTKSTLFS